MTSPIDLDMPIDALYCDSHEYLLVDEDRARIGITHFAVEQLGDIVFVDFPNIGDQFEAGDTFGTIESVKTASDLYMPVAGEIIAINTQIQEEPGLINEDTYKDGWLIEIMVKDPAELEKLLTAEKYAELIKE